MTANAAYGFTGASAGYLPMMEIAAAMTAKGREIILRAKEIVETQLQPGNDAKFPRSRVIYGDTVMRKARGLALCPLLPHTRSLLLPLSRFLE